MSGCLPEIKWSVCISKSQRRFCVSFSRWDFALRIYHLFLWSKTPCTLPFPPSHVYSSTLFCANLQLSLIRRFIISSLSPHNPILLFCCVLSIFALIELNVMAFLCTAFRKDSVSLLKFLFLCHVHVFFSEFSRFCRLKSPYLCFFLVFVFNLLMFC